MQAHSARFSVADVFSAPFRIAFIRRSQRVSSYAIWICRVDASKADNLFVVRTEKVGRVNGYRTGTSHLQRPETGFNQPSDPGVVRDKEGHGKQRIEAKLWGVSERSLSREREARGVQQRTL